MRIGKWTLVGLLAVAGVWAGCGGGDGMDAGDTASNGDTVSPGDTVGMDASDAAPDVQPDRPADVPADRPMTTMTDPCRMGAVIDLTTMMPGSDGAIHYMGNNNMAGELGGLATPDGCVVPGTASASHQVALRYRMRSTNVLRVSTNNPGTARDFDTVVMLTNACAPTNMPMGCNDDENGNMVFFSTVSSSTPIMMGTEVIIIVGGYSPPLAMRSAQGAFELTVREIAPIAVGMPCTRLDTCATGSRCLPDAGSTTMGHCVADGTRGAACRATAPFCDAMLSCSEMTPTPGAPGFCRGTVAAGMTCDYTGRSDVCAMGSSCDRTATMMARCTTNTMEMEPNTMAAPQMLTGTGPFSINGSIMPATDADCYRVAVPANGSVFVETSDGARGCPTGSDTIVRLYNPAGMMLVMDDDGGPGLCSLIDPTTMGGMAARMLPAGNYTVCVASYDMMEIPSYNVSIAVSP